MQRATRIEIVVTRRAMIPGLKVFVDGHLVTAGSTENSLLIKLTGGPDLGGMRHRFFMTEVAGKVLIATFEPDGNDICFCMVMFAPCLMIHRLSVNGN